MPASSDASANYDGEVQVRPVLHPNKDLKFGLGYYLADTPPTPAGDHRRESSESVANHSVTVRRLVLSSNPGLPVEARQSPAMEDDLFRRRFYRREIFPLADFNLARHVPSLEMAVHRTYFETFDTAKCRSEQRPEEYSHHFKDLRSFTWLRMTRDMGFEMTLGMLCYIDYSGGRLHESEQSPPTRPSMAASPTGLYPKPSCIL